MGDRESYFFIFRIGWENDAKKKSLYAPGQYSTNALTLDKTAPYKTMLSLREKQKAIQIEKKLQNNRFYK